MLTVTDNTNTANLHFTGSFSLGNFKLAADNAGGTIVYDPPIDASSDPVPASTYQNTVAGGAQIVGTTAGNNAVAAGPSTIWQDDETFAFKRDFNSHAIVNATSSDTIDSDRFSSVTEVHQLQTLLNDGQTIQSLFHAENGGHGAMMNHGDHDSISLAHVQMPDLHATNFIIHA